jgi:predicted PurR-regulated permease PerM
MILALVSSAGLLVGPALAREMRGLVEFLPTAFAQVAQELRLGSLADLLSASGSVSSLGDLASRIFAWSTTAVGAVASLVLVIAGGIYLAASPAVYRDGFVKLVPPNYHPNVNAALDDAGAALRWWIRGQFIAMVLVGVMTGLGLWLAGVPSAFALGFIAGLAEFVPIIGPILAAIPIALVAGTQGWDTLLWAIAIVILVQQVESNLITPLIADRIATVAPAVGLFAVVAMGVLFGPLGLLFGFPLAVVFDVTVRRLYVHDTLGEPVEILGEPAKESK